jgi:hypothetical protein
VVHAQEVQHPVQHQNPDFLFSGVPELAGLSAGASQGDGEVADISVAVTAIP